MKKPILITNFVRSLGNLLKPPDTTATAEESDNAKQESPTAIVKRDEAARAVPAEAAPSKPKTSQEQLIAKCFAFGQSIADATRVSKPDPAVLKTLEEKAMLFAVAATLPVYDPSANLGDRRTADRLGALDEELERAEAACEMAAAELRRRQDELPKRGRAARRPSASPLLRWSAAVCITVSLAPTLHDLLVGIFPLLRWLIAIGLGGAFGLFIVAAILPDEHIPDKEN